MTGEPQLAGQTVVLIGGSAGIGFETARRAMAEGAEVVLTGRNSDRLAQAARELGAQRTAAFDASDETAVQQFFRDLPAPIDHVLITAGGPQYGPLLEMDADEVRDAMSGHILLSLVVARSAASKMRAGGTLLFMGGTGGRRISRSLGIVSAATAALPPIAAALELELAPVRVNLIAAGFVDTPLSAALLGDDLEARREQLRATLPIRRVIGPDDILVVTPYNAQIREIEAALIGGRHAEPRVGTVDKFQGRQAPVVIYSMATSSADEAPRGLEFLYDPHRLNVATSRAKAMAIIVASPDLVRVSCRTPRQMLLANALCRAWESSQ